MIFSALLLAVSAPLPSQSSPATTAVVEDCTYAPSQTDMNICAGEEFVRADAELNKQWEATSTMMRQRDMVIDKSYDERPSYHAQLLAAQRAWIAYRDEHCTNVGYEARGGSLEPFLVARCKTALTKQRIIQLHDLEIWLE